MNPLRFLAVIAMLATGCVSRELNTKRDVSVKWWDEPCRVEVYDGPDLACRVRSPQPCVEQPPKVEVPAPAPLAPTPET